MSPAGKRRQIAEYRATAAELQATGFPGLAGVAADMAEVLSRELAASLKIPLDGDRRSRHSGRESGKTR